ncbi:MAG: universal stress protein [Acidaminococcus sp.]|jgi:nucleotide-binding universal stress UspA family protein|nr:universal stress protein [Acidaminococcus sp.]MCI2099569.1 universal stress protein [Acidaminococcus sp.]MCI2113654.1 universal stress protein [Acidaminococcus sp.]MCI2115737.1 universal stress protein [Acidaminococcus sp.]
MINKILVPIDGSEIAMRAMDFAIEMGSKFNSQIIVLNVDIPYDLSRIKPPLKDKDGNVVESAQLSPLEAAEKRAKKSGYDRISFKKYVDIDPAEKIVEAAQKNDVDLIVMGNRGMGVLAGFFLGSVSTKVSQSAPCPVTIVK